MWNEDEHYRRCDKPSLQRLADNLQQWCHSYLCNAGQTAAPCRYHRYRREKLPDEGAGGNLKRGRRRKALYGDGYDSYVNCIFKPAIFCILTVPLTRDTDSENRRVLRVEKVMPDKRMFLIAFVWIRDNLSDLLQVGWTRAALYRRGRFSYPCGTWGLAWFDVWGKDDVHIDIDKRTGAIRFTFRATNGRIISQAAYPPENQYKR